MSLLQVAIEIHLYSENQLNDDQIEIRKRGRGLFSPGFYKRLLSYQDKTIEIQIKDHTTLGEFCDLIHGTIWDGFTGVIDGPTELYFITPEARYSIDNPDSNFNNALKKHLDPESSGYIKIGLYVCEDAGSFDSDGKLTYYFHSHEQGKHNEPHVHVYYDDNSNEPLSIITGEVLSVHPRMPKKYQKQAKQYILEHQKELIKYWNVKTDGLNVDLNQMFGLSNF